MRIAAIDQGTTSTRLLVVNNQEKLNLSLALRHKQLYPKASWVEHDPLEIIHNIEQCISTAGKVDAIGIDNQGESCLAWDAITKEPLSPIIVWQDSRTATQIEKLRDQGFETFVQTKSGLPLDSYFSASKLAWLVENIPQVQAALKKGRLRLGTTDSFFLDRLTGVYLTDATTASRTALLDIAKVQWDPELCELFGVPIEALPPITDCVYDFGKTKSGIPITASVADQHAALYGHNCRSKGLAKITFGTGAFVEAATESVLVNGAKDGLLTIIAWQIKGKPFYAIDGGVYNATSAVDWAKNLGLFSDYAELAHFDSPAAISRKIAFVPALSGLACPHWDRKASSLWLGMDTSSSNKDLCQALLEGVALRSREVIMTMNNYLPIAETLSIDGGLSRSPYFSQFLADILQRKIITPKFDELTVFGCAALTALGIGEEIDVSLNEDKIYVPQISAQTANHWCDIFTEAVNRCKNWHD